MANETAKLFAEFTREPDNEEPDPKDLTTAEIFANFTNENPNSDWNI